MKKQIATLVEFMKDNEVSIFQKILFISIFVGSAVYIGIRIGEILVS